MERLVAILFLFTMVFGLAYVNKDDAAATPAHACIPPKCLAADPLDESPSAVGGPLGGPPGDISVRRPDVQEYTSNDMSTGADAPGGSEDAASREAEPEPAPAPVEQPPAEQPPAEPVPAEQPPAEPAPAEQPPAEPAPAEQPPM